LLYQLVSDSEIGKEWNGKGINVNEYDRKKEWCSKLLVNFPADISDNSDSCAAALAFVTTKKWTLRSVN
jgi:hypothetical protein